MQTSTTDIIEEFPPLLANKIPATSVAQSRYNLSQANEDLGENLTRFFDIPSAKYPLGTSGIQPSLPMIASNTLIQLTKAMIKIIGDDQVAFALWRQRPPKSRRPPSYEFSYRIFIWPAVFVSCF